MSPRFLPSQLPQRVFTSVALPTFASPAYFMPTAKSNPHGPPSCYVSACCADAWDINALWLGRG